MASTSTAEVKLYTLDEVKTHNTTADLWIVYKNNVYDVTKFLKEHPGGEEVIQDVAGKDATEAFDDVGHSTSAIEMMEKYFIGKLNAPAKGKDTTKEKKEVPRCLLAGGAVLSIAVGVALIFKGFTMSRRL